MGPNLTLEIAWGIVYPIIILFSGKSGGCKSSILGSVLALANRPRGLVLSFSMGCQNVGQTSPRVHPR